MMGKNRPNVTKLPISKRSLFDLVWEIGLFEPGHRQMIGHGQKAQSERTQKKTVGA
jgi:hypothetical protein